MRKPGIPMAATVSQKPSPRPPGAQDTASDDGGGGSLDGVQSRLLLRALSDFKQGDFNVRLPSDWVGISGKIADTFNDCMDLRKRLTRELERVSHVVGREGKLQQRASLGNVS